MFEEKKIISSQKHRLKNISVKMVITWNSCKTYQKQRYEQQLARSLGLSGSSLLLIICSIFWPFQGNLPGNKNDIALLVGPQKFFYKLFFYNNYLIFQEMFNQNFSTQNSWRVLFS